MDGFKAFKYYTALRLHFTEPNFNVFVNRGHVRGTYEKFQSRNDRGLFEKLARQYTDKNYIHYIASNFMYGNPDVIYNQSEGLSNYNEYLRRRQSITHIFRNDLDTLANNSGCLTEQTILQSFMSRKITLESAVILDSLEGTVSKLKESNIALLLADDIRRIEKSKGFVKFDPQRVQIPYNHFKEMMIK